MVSVVNASPPNSRSSYSSVTSLKIASAPLHEVYKFLILRGIDLGISFSVAITVSISMNVFEFWILLTLYFLPLLDCLHASPYNLFSYDTRFLAESTLLLEWVLTLS